MSSAAMAWAWEQCDLKWRIKLVLVALSNFAGSNGEHCFPGKKYLAEMTGLSEYSVLRAMIELENRAKVERYLRRDSEGLLVEDYRILYDPACLSYERVPNADFRSNVSANGESPAHQNRTDSPRENLSLFGPAKEKAPIAQNRLCVQTGELRKNAVPRAKTLWPDDLQLTEKMREFAGRYGVDAEREFEAWYNDCHSLGRRYRDWLAAWRTRILLTQRFGRA